MSSPCRFQSFDEPDGSATVAARVAALRARLAEDGCDGFVIPRADEHQGEYVPRCAERLAYITGFTGSAGTAVILMTGAALIVDGRYTLQSAEQTDPAVIAPVRLEDMSIESWIRGNLPKGGVLGFDPWLHTAGGVKLLEKAVAGAGGILKPLSQNPVDIIWTDRPAAPAAPVSLHPLAFAGESADDKLARIRTALREARLDGLVISDPHALAWAFNIRGGDVTNTPLALGYGLIETEARPTVFLSDAKLGGAVRAELAGLAQIAAPSALAAALQALGQRRARLRVDAATGAQALVGLIESAGGIADIGPDPIALMKARKNTTELAGARAAHLRDGAAMARFLSWLMRQEPGSATEIDAAAALEAERIATGKLKDLAFTTISAAGPNAALPHYRVSNRSNRLIGTGLYLVDSGGQYEDGTTDITRTVAIGPPTPELKDRFTRVLKGHIAISRCVFPKGVSGAQIDALARLALWQAGLDFDHGTGHGVGSYLSVHEGPQRLSKLGTTPLEPGMILSNEPGYYKPGAYGIRTENLIVVEPRDIPGAERQMLGFETISFCPYDARLIATALLDAGEIDWIDRYHGEVRRKIAPLLEGPSLDWLMAATAPLAAMGA